MHRNRFSAAVLLTAALAFELAGRTSPANEVVVQNDSIVNGATAAIESGFVAGETAAAWLTTPCAGNIVAVQVYWRSEFGGEPQTVEDNISIYTTGIFPFPNQLLAFLEGPVMNDGVLNEFRYLDENNTIPISVPVQAGQTYIVAFRFGVSPTPFLGPSVVVDANGCQPGKNAIDAQGLGWVNGCSLGISGDFFIRMVVDCVQAQGACCLTSGSCQLKTQSQCGSMGGNYRGDNTTCFGNTCDGACCFADGNCTSTNQGSCTSSAGTFKGVAVACTTNLCKGACCIPNGSCTDLQSLNDCTALGGSYKGDGTTCGGVSCTGACCYNDGSCQQQTLAQCGGIWNGPLTNCGTFTCPARGACCLPDGSCLNNQLQTDCVAAGGLYKGNNTNCTNNPCTGACCFGSSCLNLIKTDCQQIPGSVWQGPFYPCGGGNSCPLGACCLALGDCLEAVTPAQCASQNGVFHNGQTCPQANCPIPIGACCFSNGAACINGLQPLQCALISGSTWKGPNSVCAVSCCPPPMGDMNGDTAFNAVDIQRFCAAMMGTPTNLEICKGDFDGNGSLGLGDVSGMVNALLTAP